MNWSDSERVASLLVELGMKESKTPSAADIVIFNTCSIRQKAEDKVYGQLINMRKLRQSRPNLVVAFTGCMVKKSSHKLSVEKDPLVVGLQELDLVFRINELNRLPDLLKELRAEWFRPVVEQNSLSPSRSATRSSLQVPSEYAHYFQIRPRYQRVFQAFVPIMTGCDKFCSYCIVPFTRGREQSRDQSDILAECRRLVDQGCKEITLLGQNVNSYGLSSHDFDSGQFNLKERQKMGLRVALVNPPFVQLLRAVDGLKQHGLRRLRYTSSHPYDMSFDLIQAHTELETLCEHVHLPVQSGDNEMLKSMNRHYTVEHYLDLMARIKAVLPRAGLSTDIIVGFSGETEEMFTNTVRLIEKVRWNMIYFAKYSVRKGTLGARLPDDISENEKSRRWHIINELLKTIALEKNQQFLGDTVNVLVESYADGLCRGRSREFLEVVFPGKKSLIGEEVDVRVTEVQTWLLVGEMTEFASSVRPRRGVNNIFTTEKTMIEV